MFGNTKKLRITPRFYQPPKIFFIKMFEDLSNWNRKRVRWRKHVETTPKNYQSVERLFFITIFLLVSGRSCAASSLHLSFNVSENMPSGTAVGNIDGSGSFIKLEETTGVEKAFDSNQLETGKIVTKMELDREHIQQYNMSLINIDDNGVFQITVNVLDVNDNSPTFAKESITLEVSELASVGTEFNLGSALDEDAPPLNVQGYRLDGTDEFFKVNTKLLQDGSTRFAVLEVIKRLDRETIPYHTVTVEAFDGGTPTPNTGKIIVNVSISDSNDNMPVFDRSFYNASISEGDIPGTDVMKVIATDRDAGVNGDITYSIDRTKSDPDELFRINSESGTIYINKKLDSESDTEHSLTVLATDGGAQPQVGSTIVVIEVEDVNDNEPNINVIFLGASEFKVSEGAAIGDYIARISVSDPDVGDVDQFNLTLSGGDNKFGLKTENNVVYLVRVEQQLDREEKSSYDVVLKATDFGNPPKSAVKYLTIEVEDINDNPPVFDRESYHVNISEERFPGTFVYHLSAVDIDAGRNREFKYGLESSPQSEWFHLNPESGLVTTAGYLDHEIAAEVRLTITATDLGSPQLSSSTTLVVTIGNSNDSAPRFDHTSYTKTISEDIGVRECFLEVHAIDPDFADLANQIEYTFGDAVPLEIALNPTSGELCIAKSLDRETTADYYFRVKATDKAGQHAYAQVSVVLRDVNDNSPQFHPLDYFATIAAATAVVGNPVVTVSATDRDATSNDGTGFGDVTYRIISGNEGNLIAFDNKTGELTIAKSMRSHGDTVIKLQIDATDGGQKSATSSASVTINIINSTTASVGGPVFTESHYYFTVREDATSGTPVGTVLADTNGDANKVLYYLRRDPPLTDWFTIDFKNGQISLDSSTDREIFSSVKLQIIASIASSHIYGFCDVTVTITDVNDNAPILQPIYDLRPSNDFFDIVTIPQSLPATANVYTLDGFDPDDGQNGLIRYRLIGINEYFAVDLRSGIITVKKPLPNVESNYSITVEASDHGTPSLSTTATLIVQVLLDGENCPHFSSNDIKITISEDTQLSKGFYNITMSSSTRSVFRIIPSTDSYNFAIFPDGQLYLTSKLDRELKNHHQFQIAAESIRANVFSVPCVALATIEVTVTDVNDNMPYFHSYYIQFAVKENVAAGTVVGTVTASDADTGDNAVLTYSLTSGSQLFQIDSDTGTITTLSPLDREVSAKHSIVVQARDRSYSPLPAETTVQIFVQDENDNAPQFLYSSSPVLFVIKKDSQDPVAVIQAVDIDIGANSDIEYSIIGGQNDLFKIDANTAQINSRKDLDAGATYTLNVQASDRGSKIQKSSSIELQVKVSDGVSNPYLFSEMQYAFFSSIDVKPRDILGWFSNETTSSRRVKRDTETVKLTNFYIAEGNLYDHFYVNLSTGELIVLKKPTYEDTPQFILKVTAENAADATDIRTFRAQINVQDTNDFTPTFSSASYLLTVREDSPIDTMIWKFSAVDHDIGRNGHISYTITNQTANSMLPMPSNVTPFRIDAAMGQLYTNDFLDREEFPEYILIVKATDGSATNPKSTSVSVVITIQDVNDNPPKFVSRNEVYIFEDEPIEFPVLYLAAEDPDLGANSHIIYEIARQWTDTNDNVRSFHVDPSTGLISLIAKLDFETSPVHYLNVSATDSSALDPFTTYELVVVRVIDINDKSPEFDQNFYFAQVSEDVEDGSLVARVKATDGDSGINGEVTYEIHDQTDTFTINEKTGVITTKKELDRESVDSYDIVVYAHDGAFPSLYSWCSMRIEVLDVNDNKPQFAYDQDVLFVSSEMILATVSVPEYEVNPSHIHTVLATDPDSGENGIITFSIADGNVGDSFTIDETSGQVWTAGHLDRETTDFYHLKLVVTDHGNPNRSSEAFLNIIVTDWNDNDPKFDKSFYQANIAEGLAAGQFVLDVHADDADVGLNGLVTYSIDPDVQQQNQVSSIRTEGLFSIHPETGVITTTAVLDREQASIHQFVVQANDSAPYGPRKTSVTVTVNVLDINDNHPVFKDSLIIKNVSQNTPIGSDVATVSAEDKDAGLNATVTYRISGGKSEPYVTSWLDNFAIDGNGLITTTQALSGGHMYYLDIEASDSGNPPLSSIAVVTVNVVPFVGSGSTKVQFSKNTYYVNLSEGAKKYSAVTQVAASMVDDGGASLDKSKVAIAYSFHSGNEDDTFAINSSGVITVKNPKLLDYETAPRITLMVLATASSPEFADTIAYATISISLIDANDNAPVFEPDRYVTSTFEEEDEGMFVIQVRAHDIDQGLNGEIRYDIDSGNKQKSFNIDHVTGIVTTALKLDREIHDEYKLMVRANDLGDPQQSSDCVLRVTVVDKNDHEPTLLFLPADGLSISEKTEVGKMITVATANDPDTGNVTFQFSTNRNNQNEYFVINSDNGKVHLAKPIDYELMKSAIISVQATDGQHIVEKEIVVSIEDVNDNAPVFEKDTYQASLDELSPVEMEVVKIVATDADSGLNSRVRYSVIDIIPQKPAFYIDSITGVISTNLSEPYNPHSSIYTLIVMATDQGTPALNSTVPVRIEVRDINNHAPIFTAKSYAVSVKENAEKYTHVINVSAIDGDFADANRDVYYEITSGNIKNAFQINTLIALDGGNNIGEIRVAGDLDREFMPFYALKITAFDHGDPQNYSSTTLNVTLVDVNDNQPFFNQSSYWASIPEDATGEPVVMVFADDRDSSSSLTFKITAGNTHSAFEIVECDPPSAGCALISAIKLDYEEIPEYLLSVQVWDGRDTRYSKSSVVSVTIEVLDVNEFSPYYPAAFGFKRVAETIQANQSIYTVPAIDHDSGVYGELIYTIINDGNSNSSGTSCIPADEMFYIVPETGEVKTKQLLDYEKCHKYFFTIKVENLRTGDLRLSRRLDISASYLRVEFEVTSVDEYPPVFSAGADSQLKFVIPYSADIGYLVGQVNATDADEGRDGTVEYEIDDEYDFAIGRSSGAITVKQKLSSHNARVLTVTARSGVRSAHIFVAVEITGAPASAMQAQIIGIVFGVIVVAAIVIAVVVCRRVRSRKSAREQSNSSHNPSEFNDTRKIVAANSAPKMANGEHKTQAVGKQSQRSENGHVKMANGVKQPNTKNSKPQLVVPNGIRSNQKSAAEMNRAANGHAGRQIFHFHNGHAASARHSLSSGRGSEQDDDIDVDREVDLINSLSDATNNYGSGVPKVKVRKKISNQGGNIKQVADSGIQKDMDCGSDISDGPNNIHSPSVESIHIFGDEGAGEEPLSIQEMEEDLQNEQEHRIPATQSGESGFSKSEIGSRYKSGSESNGSNSNKSSINSKRGSDGADSGYGRRGKFTDWRPEFKPLADVFSKLTTVKDHENAMRSGNKNTFVMKDLSIPPSFDANDPPPLITSVAEQRSDLVAPVPIITNRMQQRRSVGNMGVYHAPHPTYIRNTSHPASSSYLPTMYSNVAKTPEIARSNVGYNGNPVRPQVAFNVPTFVQVSPSVNSSQQGLSVSSLPRTPISHESSFTSPALSPNLSPSLSPLATRSPSVSTVGDGVFFQTQYDSDEGGNLNTTRSRSDPNLADCQSDFDDDKNERMVHV